MPMYDRHCLKCGATKLDLLEPMATTDPVCACGGQLERAFLPTGRGTVIGDEIDVTIRHGMCHKDGTPQRFRSRAELRRAEQKAGLTNHVVHMPGRGTDKSKHTTRWI